MIFKDKVYHKYITVSDIDKNWGLYLTGAGYTEVCGNEEYPCKDHPQHHHFHWSKGRILTEFQILYISKGKGVFESDDSRKKKVYAGDVFILFPDVWHRFSPDKNTGWNEYWIEFNGMYAEYLMESGFLDPKRPVIKLNGRNEIIDSFLKLIKFVREEEIAFQFLASGILLEIIGRIEASKVSGSFKGKDVENMIKKAKSIIADNLDQNIFPERIATQMGVSYSLFRQQFKRYTGFSPIQYQIERRIQKAREMLLNTNFSIKEIANLLGFRSLDYMSRLFKQKTGKTPREIRRDSFR